MDIKQIVRIIVKTSSNQDRILAYRLAHTLGLPEPRCSYEPVPFFLFYNEGRLELSENSSTPHNNLFVDFLSGRSWFRFKSDLTIRQPLAKAIGIKPGVRPSVCDATAGFGSDAFVFAALGCSVTMFERSPIMWALLDDGLRRASGDKQVGEWVKNRMTLIKGDAINYIDSMKMYFDTIYLDPMFPHRSKSALNKRYMRVLRSIVGDGDDSSMLLETAKKAARRRVAVKRPKMAKPINFQEPSFCVNSKKGRYDIYLTHHL